ncbi:nucleoside deaminase [Ornithinimicrobium sp. Y1694]|uniref:nucleoside deaminase n=1 Tax=Ornithinimicrobium sp. Y1694 TaxID=3418590 RepID=UPI003CEFC79C
MAISDEDRRWLKRAVDLAEQALEAGDQPFGSVLVSGEGELLFEDHNHVSGGDATQHPELAAVRWAVEHLSPEERAAATVYTSGEHCAMCSAAHGWVGLGRIVIASSNAQLQAWAAELGLPDQPVRPLAITDVVPGAVVDGPDPELAQRVRGLHATLVELTAASGAHRRDRRGGKPTKRR